MISKELDMRSPNYPAVGLSEAVALAQAVWGREKRSFAPSEAIVQAWGYSGLSGNARTKIAALRKYGLLEVGGESDLRLTDLAINILHNPVDSPERLEALRKAALSPDLFSELQQTYSQASNETLRSYLITRKGFSETGAESCIEAFRDTQDFASLNETNVVVQAPAVTPPPTLLVRPQPDLVTVAESVSAKRDPSPMTEPETVYRWPLSRDVTAEVKFIGEVKPAHLDLLKMYLNVAKEAMADERTSNPSSLTTQDSHATNEE
jgi:hypothetical protein